MADPVLIPLTAPVDLALPANTQQLVNMVAAYVQISGLSGLQGIIISATEPTAPDRDKAWLKLDVSTGRCIGLYRYAGGWTLVPVIMGSGTTEPGNAKPGELFLNTQGDAVKAFLAGGWTTELWHKCTTALRPTGVPDGYLCYDTDIKRLLRSTSSGWTTADGGIGELRMFTGITVADCILQNPGWDVDTAMAGLVPLGQDGDLGEYPVGKQAGRASFDFTATGQSAQGGTRDTPLISSINIDGNAASGATGNGGSSTKTGTIPILPPYRSVIFMRKSY